jgi:hypothetical protein
MVPPQILRACLVSNAARASTNLPLSSSTCARVTTLSPWVYRFLLKAQDHNEESARAEFVRFLRGELSERLLQDARRWVQEEQARAALDGLGREISVRNRT